MLYSLRYLLQAIKAGYISPKPLIQFVITPYSANWISQRTHIINCKLPQPTLRQHHIPEPAVRSSWNFSQHHTRIYSWSSLLCSKHQRWHLTVSAGIILYKYVDSTYLIIPSSSIATKLVTAKQSYAKPFQVNWDHFHRPQTKNHYSILQTFTYSTTLRRACFLCNNLSGHGLSACSQCHQLLRPTSVCSEVTASSQNVWRSTSASIQGCDHSQNLSRYKCLVGHYISHRQTTPEFKFMLNMLGCWWLCLIFSSFNKFCIQWAIYLW